MFIRSQTEFIALLFLAEMFWVTKLYVVIYKCYLDAASLMLGCFGINCELLRSCVDQNNCFTKFHCFFKKIYIDAMSRQIFSFCLMHNTIKNLT